jgi:hypothetical protein
MKDFKSITLTPAKQDRFDVTIRLSDMPPDKWADIFNDLWGTPFYLTWRFAYLKEGVITIRACTLDEYNRYHRDMLEKTVSLANQKYMP